MQLCQVLAYVIAYAQFAFRCHDLIKFLILQLFAAKRVVTLDLTALLLMRVDLGQLEYLITELAGDPE